MHLGIKLGYELFPAPLTRRVKQERKERLMESQSAAMAKAQKNIADWEAANTSPSDEKKREKKDLGECTWFCVVILVSSYSVSTRGSVKRRTRCV